ncbi:hypothetical protein Tco_1581244, partial [Tanacetum coccineum]
VDRGGGECGCEDKSVCAWEDKILSAFMIKKSAWREYLVGVFGMSFWREFLAGVFGGSFWRSGLIPFKTDQEILDEVVPSDNRQNMSGMGRKLPGGGSTSRRRANRAFGDIMTRDQITQMFRQQDQEKELHRL